MFEPDKTKLNILIITANANFGGIENVVYSIFRKFKELGHNVDFMITEVEGELSEKLKAECVNVESCVGLNKFKQILYSIKYLKKNNYDVIFLNHAKVFQSVLGVLENHNFQ